MDGCSDLHGSTCSITAILGFYDGAGCGESSMWINSTTNIFFLTCFAFDSRSFRDLIWDIVNCQHGSHDRAMDDLGNARTCPAGQWFLGQQLDPSSRRSEELRVDLAKSDRDGLATTRCEYSGSDGQQAAGLLRECVFCVVLPQRTVPSHGDQEQCPGLVEQSDQQPAQPLRVGSTGCAAY